MSDEKSGLGPDDRGNLRDDQSFTQFFHVYGPVVYQWALARLKNKQAAEDVVATVFENYFRYRYDIDKDATNLLSVMTKNECIDYIKDNPLMVDPGLAEDAISSWPGTENEIGHKLAVMAVLKEAERVLPKICKMVFKLAMRRMSNEDIAKMLNIKQSTVRNQKARAIKKLQPQFPELDLRYIFPET